MKGFDLRLEDFCEYCGDFEADIEKTDVTCYCDKTKRYRIDITCANIDKCRRIKENLANK